MTVVTYLLKSVEHMIEHDIDSTLHVLDISELYSRLNEYLPI